MDERVAAAVVVLVVCAGAVPLAVGAQSAESPTITVHTDADPLDPGEDHHTPTDPLVQVQVSADAPISLVEIRVDGTTRHVFEPSRERFDRSVSLDLETGHHRLTVVARADGVATYEATLAKDDEAPVLNYSSPFAAEAEPDDPDSPPSAELTVNRGNVTVNGTLTDLSTVDAVRVEHDYDYRLPTESTTDREATRKHLLPSPGDRFAQSLYLVPGPNTITVYAEDAVGNVRTHEFTVAVDDETAPSLTITDVEWVSPTRLHIEGHATDRVQVQAVWLASETDADDEGGERHPLVFPKSTAPDRDRGNVTFDTTVYHPRDTDHLVLGTNDTAGNERTWNYSLATFLAPNVTVDDGRTGYVADRTVAVGGRVVDGQVRGVSVEAVDPETGRLVDIQSVELGADGAFDTRLAAPSDETQIRVRVRDASGAEHLTNATVAEPLDRTAVPPENDGGGDDSSSAGGGDADGDAAGAEASGEEQGGVRIPVVDVVVPVPTPDVGGILSASASLPIPVVGPIEVPLLTAGIPVVLVLAAVGRRVR